MNVLILGGTSFFGRDIARLLHENKHKVALFTRGNARPPGLPPHRHIKGDRNSAEDLKKAAAAGPWDAVIDNIGYTGDEVRLALDAFRGHAGRYLFCSTVSVYRYAPDTTQPVREDAVDHAWKPPGENRGDKHWKYARGKLEAEQATMAEKTLAWTILRPPVVYGPYDVSDRGFWYLARLGDGGPLLLANDGAHSFRLAYSVDVAKAFLLALEKPKTAGRIYNIAQSEVITLRSFVADSAATLGIEPELLGVPLDYLGELAGPYANMVNFIPDASAAERDLGLVPTPWREFGPLTARWFRDQWKGDRSRLLATRREELTLAKKWRETVGPLEKRVWT